MSCYTVYQNIFKTTSKLKFAIQCFFQLKLIISQSHTSHCSIIISYVTSEGNIVERFLDFHDISTDRSAETLFSLLDRVLSDFDYDKLIA